jgi:hypothetical protein
MQIASTLAALTLAVTMACGSLSDPDRRDLDRYRDLWRAQGIVSYDYTLRRLCFCPVETTDSMRVQVRSGQIVAATYIATGAAASVQFAVTIDQIFDDIERTLRDGKVLSIRYDPVRGFPTEAHLDRVIQAIDDEGVYFASELVPKTP